MKLLYEFDLKDYDGLVKISRRDAVRAIVFRDGLLAMVFSRKEGDYKFPGGGIKPGESHRQALLREAREEAGLVLLPGTIREFGMLHEVSRSFLYEDEIFDHSSYYYFAEAGDEAAEQDLDDYEADLGYELAYVPVEKAYQVNLARGKAYHSTFILREAKVLELLLAEQKK